MRHAWMAAAVMAAGLAGCSSPTTLNFEGGDRVNYNKERQENVPVNIAVFMLKDKTSFLSASPEQLWKTENAKAVLGLDLVGEPRGTTINAGGKEKIELGQLHADVKFVGVLAKLPKQDPPVTRHFALTRDEADDYPIFVTEYRIEVKKK